MMSNYTAPLFVYHRVTNDALQAFLGCISIEW